MHLKGEISNNEKGSVSIIVLVIILLISIFGITMLTLSVVDLKSSYNIYWKNKSNSLSDYAIEEYKARLNDVFYNENYYEITEDLVSEFDTTPISIEEDGVLNALIEFEQIEISNLSGEHYQYLDESLSTNVGNGTFLYQEPPHEDYKLLDYESVVKSGRGKSSIDGDFNPAYQYIEFMIGKYFVDGNGKLQKIEIYDYSPLMEDIEESGVSEVTPLISVSVEEMNTIMSSSVSYNFDKFNLNDEINITTVWDKNRNSPQIVLSLTVKEDRMVHYFYLIPISTSAEEKLEYFDTIIFDPDEEILKTSLQSIFDYNSNSVIFNTSILFKKASEINEIVSYDANLLIDEVFSTHSKVSLTKSQVTTIPEEEMRVFGSDMYWSEAANATELMLFVVKDKQNADLDTLYNSEIEVYSVLVNIEDRFSKVGTLNLEPHFPDNEVYINEIASSLIWREEVNDGYATVFFSSPNKVEPYGKDRLFKLDTTLIDFNVDEIMEVDLSEQNINKIGKLSVSNVNATYNELLLMIEKPLVLEEEIILEPSGGSENIKITTFRENGEILAVTKISMKPKIEIVSLENSNVRFVKKFELLDLKVR